MTGVRRLGALCLVLAAVAGAAALAVPALSTRSGPSFPTYRVASEPFRREVPADGNLKAVEATPILVPTAARMELKIAWIVEDGTRLSEGDVVARFDPGDMKERLRDSKADKTQVKKRIDKERLTADAARRKRNRDAEIAEKEMLAAKQFEASNDDEVFSRNEIIESQIDSEFAAARLDHARAAESIERTVARGKIDVLRGYEKQVAMRVARAEQALSTREIRAPHAGIALLRADRHGRTVSVGDSVWPGQKLAELPQDATLEARLFVLEADGGTLEAGQKVSLVVEAAPDRTFAGTVKSVDTLAKPRFQEVPVQYFGVVVSLDETDTAVMKIGQRVRATILLEESEAITVPRQAVFTVGNQSFVYRRTPLAFERVDVELGAGTAGRVIVENGLADGDEIALRDPTGSGGNKAAQEGSRAAP